MATCPSSNDEKDGEGPHGGKFHKEHSLHTDGVHRDVLVIYAHHSSPNNCKTGGTLGSLNTDGVHGKAKTNLEEKHISVRSRDIHPSTELSLQDTKAQTKGRRGNRRHMAIFGHGSQEASNVQDDNKRMVQRILAVANRSSGFPSQGREHDRVCVVVLHHVLELKSVLVLVFATM